MSVKQSEISIFIARTDDDFLAAHEVYRVVFELEQGVRRERLRDGYERDFASTRVFLARDEKSIIGTCRARRLDAFFLRLEMLAVLPSERRSGVGALLVENFIHFSRSRDAGVEFRSFVPIAHVQIRVLKFYEKRGWSVVSECFEEEGIEHVVMVYATGRERLEGLSVERVMAEKGAVLGMHAEDDFEIVRRIYDVLKL